MLIQWYSNSIKQKEEFTKLINNNLCYKLYFRTNWVKHSHLIENQSKLPD